MTSRPDPVGQSPGNGDAETIFALSSGRLPAGVAVLRVSGPATFRVVKILAGSLPEFRQMEVRTIRSRSGEILDRGLVVVFPGPQSFTGEDSAELHLHGSRAVVAAVSRELASHAGVRLASAGEFTLRAFANGKLDLTKAEALADLVEAETDAQRRFALGNSSGRNATLYEGWRSTLTDCRAMIEAELDFPEEEDIPPLVSTGVWTTVTRLAAAIDSHLKAFHRSEIIREGYRVAIIGAPNAGKSSLLNALAGRDAAIVSNEPGTTRDLIEVALDLDGLKVILTDTAGLRSNAGAVEREGIARAMEAARKADLVLVLSEDGSASAIDGIRIDARTLLVHSKIDLVEERDSREIARLSDRLAISTRTGEGVSGLIEEIARRAAEAAGGTTDVLPFRERHFAELTAAHQALLVFQHMQSAPLELAAEQLRLASNHLARIVGAIDVEDILDAVFSRFCIGK